MIVIGVQPNPTSPVTGPRTMPKRPRRLLIPLLEALWTVLQHKELPTDGDQLDNLMKFHLIIMNVPVLHWETPPGAAAARTAMARGAKMSFIVRI